MVGNKISSFSWWHSSMCFRSNIKKWMLPKTLTDLRCLFEDASISLQIGIRASVSGFGYSFCEDLLV
jgi:hypothetical protein